MFDCTADPVLVVSQIYREAYARAVEKIAARQLGLAFIDLPVTRPDGFEPMREAA